MQKRRATRGRPQAVPSPEIAQQKEDMKIYIYREKYRSYWVVWWNTQKNEISCHFYVYKSFNLTVFFIYICFLKDIAIFSNIFWILNKKSCCWQWNRKKFDEILKVLFEIEPFLCSKMMAIHSFFISCPWKTLPFFSKILQFWTSTHRDWFNIMHTYICLRENLNWMRNSIHLSPTCRLV